MWASSGSVRVGRSRKYLQEHVSIKDYLPPLFLPNKKPNFLFLGGSKVGITNFARSILYNFNNILEVFYIIINISKTLFVKLKTEEKILSPNERNEGKEK